MSDKDVRYSKDGNWQVTMSAFKINLGVYQTIGTNIKVRHKEMVKQWFGLGGSKQEWVERPVSSIAISNSFSGTLANHAPGVASRSNAARNQSSCDCSIWAVGIGITINENPSTGLPNPGNTQPSSPGIDLGVTGVQGTGNAVIGSETIFVGPVGLK
ncbi:MAG TPA: hypothetical protein VG759_25825 [Candidatus Angelobacter sp.]|jgi:hypothetical protein|nr:hypothetical protein [Candidatus Angelobacter sp.]